MKDKTKKKVMHYENNAEKLLCHKCGKIYKHIEAFRRHFRTIHAADRTFKHWNCWVCDLQFQRKDNYNRHNETLKHQINLERYLLPAEERSHIMNLKVDNVKVPEYKPTDVNLLTTYTRIIPLTSTTAVMDPRTPPGESYYSTYRNKLFTNEITKGSFTTYTNPREDVAELREQPVEIPLETNDKIWDPRKKTFMELLLSDMSATEILDEMNLTEKPKPPTKQTIEVDYSTVFNELSKILQDYQPEPVKKDHSELENMLKENPFFDIPTPPSDDTFQDITETMPIEQNVKTTVTRDEEDEMITLSIEEIPHTEAWFTLDEFGATADESQLLPPTAIDFLI
jgi:hypothetical protein